MLVQNNTFRYKILTTGSHFIHLFIRGNDFLDMFCSTTYIHPQLNRNNQCFENIKVVGKRISVSWVLIADFNEILCETEKKGGAPWIISIVFGSGVG